MVIRNSFSSLQELTKDDTPLVIYNTDDTSSNVLADKVVATDNKLTLTYEISSIGFDSNGDYGCESKNKAFNKTEATDSQELTVVVVQDVEIGTLNNLEVDFEGSVTLNFTVTGGRPPKSVTVTKTPHTILNWPNNNDQCTGDNELQCSVTITAEDWSYDGEYTVIAKNDASEENVEDTKTFKVTVYMDVETIIAISESDPAKIKYGKDLTITCTAEGGKEPHSMKLTYPDNTEYKWDRNGAAGTDTLTCSGDHEVTCTHVLASPGYTSDGSYTCSGHNVGSDGGDVNSTQAIQLTIVQDPLVSTSLTELSMLTTDTKNVNCTVESKPNIGKEKFNGSFEARVGDFLLALKLSLPQLLCSNPPETQSSQAIPQIKWRYPNGTEVDHDSMVVYRSIDSHTWSAELTLTTPHKDAEGGYTCVANGVGASVTVTIAGNIMGKFISHLRSYFLDS
eukprot:sb/3464628/